VTTGFLLITMSDPNPPSTPDSLSSLPEVRTRHKPDEIVRKLDGHARKGRLAGFSPRNHDALFSADAFAAPFDHELLARATFDGTHTVLRFQVRMLPKMPVIMIVILVLTIWPGVWVTESMLSTYFQWYRLDIWWTCAWYIPMTLGPLPWLWKKWVVGSKREALEHALEVIASIRECLTPPSSDGHG